MSSMQLLTSEYFFFAHYVFFFFFFLGDYELPKAFVGAALLLAALSFLFLPFPPLLPSTLAQFLNAFFAG